MAIELGHCSIDIGDRAVKWPDRTCRLTPIEAQLVEYLHERAGEVVPKAELLTEVWGYHPDSRSHTVGVIVRRVRSKIEVDPSQPLVLRTVRGQGWRLAPPEAPQPAQTNLLPARDAFFGRESERAQLATGRLNTIVGAPGIGKSRLAAEVAHEIGAQGDVREVHLCDLESESTAADVVARVAQTLGVALLREGDWTERVGRALAGRGAVLLVLDGAERARDAVAAVLDRWLDLAPHARFLVTSRHRLRVSGERVCSLAPLGADAARALFLDRASSRAELSDDPGPVDDLVALVEGIPLALELAAARIGLHGIASIVDSLRGPATEDGPLQAAVAWTVDLLAPWEAEAFARTAVFVDGLTLEAAEDLLVTDAHPGREALSSLVDRSLLRRVATDAKRPKVRFRAYRFIREHAARCLADQPELAAETRAQHAAHYARYGNPTWLATLRHDGGLERRLELQRERGNLEAASHADDIDAAVGATRALHAVVCSFGPVQRGLERVDALLARADLPAAARLQVRLDQARALVLVGRTAAAREALHAAQALEAHADVHARSRFGILRHAVGRRLGTYEDPWADEMLAWARATGDPAEVSVALNNLGQLAFDRSDYPTAIDFDRQAIDAAHEAGDARGELMASVVLAQALRAAGDPEGTPSLRRAVERAHELGLADVESLALTSLADAYRVEDDAESALEVGEAAIRVNQALGLVARHAASVGNVGLALLEMDDVDGAIEALSDAVQRLAAIGWPAAEGAFGAALAEAHARAGDVQREQAEHAIAKLEPSGRKVELAIAWCRLGHVAMHDDDPDAARRALAEADAIATDSEAPAWLRERRRLSESIAALH